MSDQRLNAEQVPMTASQMAVGESTQIAPDSSGSSHAPQEGRKFGPYQILSKIGAGGMGAVYKARHIRLDKIVAIKILPVIAGADSKLLARFDREMRAIGRLEHPHIVQAFDAGEIDGVHYLAMEYVDGMDLREHVKTRGRMSVVNACRAIRQAALALAHAHQAGLVHRDVKPSNLLVTKSGKTKLLDLGLARLADDLQQQSRELTNEGTCFGTPDYMAPEQWDDAHAAGPAADLYAIGCSLYCLLVGHAPWETEAFRTMGSKLKAHITLPPPDLAVERSDVPVAIVEIYRRLLAKDPTDRFASAAELASALEPWCLDGPRSGSSSVAAATQPATASSTALEPPALVEFDPTEPSERLQRSKKRREASGVRRRSSSSSIVAGVLLVVFLSIGLIVFFRSVDPRPPQQRDQQIVSAAGAGISPVATASSSSTNEGATNTGWYGWPVGAPVPAIAPFDSVEAAKRQRQWADYLQVPVEFRNSLGMRLRLIPPGEFKMGDGPETLPEVAFRHPQRQVHLTEPFWISEHELTIAQYRLITGRTANAFPGLPETVPAQNFTWYDALDFCNRLSEAEKLSPAYDLTEIVTGPEQSIARANVALVPDHEGYRLPTEAEWEYAYRAGTESRFYFDSSDMTVAKQYARLADDGKPWGPIPVGSRLANPWGLYDMEGNTAEWVLEAWNPDLLKSSSGVNPIGSISGTNRTSRGTSWGWWLLHGGAGTRLEQPLRANGIGLRVVRTIRHRNRQPIRLPAPAQPDSPIDASRETASASTDSSAWEGGQAGVVREFGGDLHIKFCWCPAGTFVMGSPESEVGRQPGEDQVEVTLSTGFWLGQTEVTKELWRRVVGTTPWSGKKYVHEDDATPATFVSWDDATSFCRQLTEREQKAQRLPGNWSYRLPTEAEWEYACRAGSKERFCYGDPEDYLSDYAWWGGFHGGNAVNEQYSHPVGQKFPNAWGLYDMHGNAYEWCQDVFVANLPGGRDPLVLSGGVNRIHRSAGWSFEPSFHRSAHRDCGDPHFVLDDRGFRIALSPARN